MSSYKLYKQERKLKEMPGMEKPVRHFYLTDTPKQQKEFEADLKRYNDHVADLKEYDINPDDWVNFDDDLPVQQHEIEVEVKTAHPAILKPSAKESQGAEKKHEVAIQAAKKIGILSGPPLACFCDGYDAAFKEGDQEKFILALKKDITDLYEEQFKDRQEIERLKEELNRMTRLYNELNHLTSGY